MINGKLVRNEEVALHFGVDYLRMMSNGGLAGILLAFTIPPCLVVWGSFQDLGLSNFVWLLPRIQRHSGGLLFLRC